MKIEGKACHPICLRWRGDVIFGMFAVDSSLNESLIAICEYNNLDSNMRGMGKGLSGRQNAIYF
jgi:hypothetical protein